MKINKKVFFPASVLILAAGLVWFLWLNQERDDSQADQKEMFWDVAFKDYAGREVKLSSFEGRPVIVSAWASWCYFCAGQMSRFSALQTEMENRAVFVLINRAESLEKAKQFSERAGTSGDTVLLLDHEDAFYKAIGGFAMPETIFLNKAGVMLHHRRGLINTETIKRWLSLAREE